MWSRYVAKRKPVEGVALRRKLDLEMVKRVLRCNANFGEL